jgi:hypothetical protein
MTRVTAGLQLDYKRERQPLMDTNGEREWTRIGDANENLTQRRKDAKVKTTTADGHELRGWGEVV